MVGSSCIDHIWQIADFPPQHSRTHAKSYQLQGGGCAATAAVTASRLGAYAELWSWHGDDANGQAASQELRHFGVNIDYLRSSSRAQTTVSGILVSPQGERYIFPYMDSSIDDSLEGLDFSRIARFDCVLSDSQHPILNEAVLQAAKAAKVPIVADFGNTRNWHLAAYTDYLIVSEECACDVLGRNDPEAALAALRHHDEQYVGITLGEEGYLYEQSGHRRHIPAFAVEVVDTTGAGDVFHGAFAYGIARGWNLDYCGLFASVTAALSCTALGGRAAIPDAATVEQLLQEQDFRELS